jgi:hypothetical protein
MGELMIERDKEAAWWSRRKKRSAYHTRDMRATHEAHIAAQAPLHPTHDSSIHSNDCGGPSDTNSGGCDGGGD